MPPIKKPVIPSKPTSKVWRYFGDNLDGEFAHCLLCKYHPEKGVALHIKVGGGSTQAMRNHMKWHHKKEYSDMEKEESEEKKARTPLGLKLDNTPKIGDAIRRMTKVDPQGKKQSAYDKKLLELLACQFIPFGVVDSEEFKSFVGELDKAINLKCARTYSRQMEELALEVLVDVKKVVEEFCTSSAAITTDLWTSRARDSYISITLHFVDNLYRLHRY